MAELLFKMSDSRTRRVNILVNILRSFGGSQLYVEVFLRSPDNTNDFYGNASSFKFDHTTLKLTSCCNKPFRVDSNSPNTIKAAIVPVACLLTRNKLYSVFILHNLGHH